MQSGCAGCCDCGDPEAWEVAGFCKKHSGFEEFSEETIIATFGKEFLHNFRETLSTAFYLIFNLNEDLLFRATEKTPDNQLTNCMYKPHSITSKLFS